LYNFVLPKAFYEWVSVRPIKTGPILISFL
jgi:hypothetical protein